MSMVDSAAAVCYLTVCVVCKCRPVQYWPLTRAWIVVWHSADRVSFTRQIGTYLQHLI